jgi:hypothetical protein
VPVTPIRDLEIQKRETDLVAASFGRGFFVLDDYSALRTLSNATLAQPGTLFAAGRKARVYDEIGYYRAQGDNAASTNPPPGVLLTYYLRDEAGGGGKYVLTVSDATGKQVRQIDADQKSGLHRTPWDLRETPPPAPAAAAGGGGRGGRGGGGLGGGRGFGRSGPLVKPGSYTVTLGRLADGQLTALGSPQTVEVVALER